MPMLCAKKNFFFTPFPVNMHYPCYFTIKTRGSTWDHQLTLGRAQNTNLVRNDHDMVKESS